MPNIFYYTKASGEECAKWPGKTVYKDGKPRKEGQINLGLVVDKEKNIFWNRTHGYCVFDPNTQELSEAPLNEIPTRWKEVDRAKREPPVCVDFGDSYFLYEFIKGIEYDNVINVLKYGNRDRLFSMIHFYVLENLANNKAETWYDHNYIRLLYPQANMASQRISDMLAALGDLNQKRDFLKKHIEYVIANSSDGVSVLIDSTGLPNSCDLPITRVSNHEGDVNIEFRMIALVQKNTGLPLYYELVNGNIVDVSTVDYIARVAREHGCPIDYMIGDAGYGCPRNIEKLILSGIDFMSRINPTYDAYSKLINELLPQLQDPANTIRYRDRFVRVVKHPCTIGTNQETGQNVTGYMYLCLDLASKAYKESTLQSSGKAKTMSIAQFNEYCQRLGVFAIVCTRNLGPEEVLPEYYVRLEVEQFFDFGKNYSKYLPVRQHNMLTLGGHMLIAFIASFLIALMHNRLNILDSHYTEIPGKLVTAEVVDDDEKEYFYIDEPDGRKIYYLEQDPVKDVFKESPSSLFLELRGQKAQVFDDNVVIPCPVHRQAKDYYDAFRLISPVSIICNAPSFTYEFKTNKEKNRLKKKVAFATKAFLTDQEIEEKRVKRSMDRLEKLAEEAGVEIKKPVDDTRNDENNEQKNVTVEEVKSDAEAKKDPKVKAEPEIELSPAVPVKRGRRPGSKNKKTLEREAREKEEQERLAHTRGRKPHSKNKKTLEREAREREEAKRRERNAKRRERYARKKLEAQNQQQ